MLEGTGLRRLERLVGGAKAELVALEAVLVSFEDAATGLSRLDSDAAAAAREERAVALAAVISVLFSVRAVLLAVADDGSFPVNWSLLAATEDVVPATDAFFVRAARNSITN